MDLTESSPASASPRSAGLPGAVIAGQARRLVSIYTPAPGSAPDTKIVMSITAFRRMVGPTARGEGARLALLRAVPSAVTAAREEIAQRRLAAQAAPCGLTRRTQQGRVIARRRGARRER